MAGRQDDGPTGFDVFLSHNSHDKPAVRKLARALEGRGVTVWLDDEQLRPGVPWQKLLEDAIRSSKTVVVTVGPDGLGPWEGEEMRAALSLAVEDGRPVIPSLLPGAPGSVDLPLFLRGRTWVDLWSGLTTEGIELVVWGITGEKPRGDRRQRTRSDQPHYRSQRARELSEKSLSRRGFSVRCSTD